MIHYIKSAIIAMVVSIGILATSVAFTLAHADEPAIYTSWNNNVAVGGYDAVSFHQGQPLEGNSDHIMAYKGAVWLFSTQSNLDTFRGNPDRYTPQYGGYCAWAVAKGKLAKGSPEAWYIQDGKLYLNFNSRIAKKWKKKIPQFIEKADVNWPQILKE